MQRGSCGFALPKHQNLKYININIGMHFGIIDIVASLRENEKITSVSEIVENWMSRKEKLKRHFTIVADDETHLLTLSTENLNRMKFDFLDNYEQLFRDALCRYKKVL